jgi:biotin carboxylase
VAATAEFAGVHGIPYDVARMAHNKAKVREALQNAGLNRYQPDWDEICIHCVESDDSWVAEDYTYPCVIKPLHQRASRGVTIVQDASGIRTAIEKAKDVSGEESYLLCEECLLGTEHSAEMLLGKNGECYFFNVVDRIFQYDTSIPMELGHINPSMLSQDEIDAIYDMMWDAALALGVDFGPFKCDIMMTVNGPKILECTTRLSGGFDSAGTCPLTGRHPMRILLQMACNLPNIDEPKDALTRDIFAAAPTIWAPKRGRLVSLPFCLDPEVRVIWNVKVGNMVQPPTHLAERCGFVLMRGSTAEEAWREGSELAESLGRMMDIEEEACPQS